ncbi:MAG: DinB family protein [Deltaproteobacteria bacterium]|jgi:hypothetical protein|nr:DinB family protein [Deltaproteobacteria bacterium]
MTRSTVESLSSAMTESAALIEKLINHCPDHLWTEKAGNWPIWQRLAHCCNSVNFFKLGQSLPLPDGLTLKVADLEVVGTSPLTKDALRDFFKAALTKLKTYLASLNDQDLAKDDPNICIQSHDLKLLSDLFIVYGYFLYHLGGVDALLTSQGYESIFNFNFLSQYKSDNSVPRFMKEHHN